jgi:hypothetical protein
MAAMSTKSREVIFRIGTVAARWWVAQRNVSRLEMVGPVGGVVHFLSAARF